MKPAMSLIVASLLLTPLLLAGMAQLPVGTNVPAPSVEKEFNITYETHGPISIAGDDAFETYAESELWDGVGSIAEPYIIEGYSISYDGDCISLSNISLYFEIHGCVLNSSLTPYSGEGMDWSNVTHGKVFDTIVYQKNCAMLFRNSPSTIVRGCSLYDLIEAGIWSVGSEGVTIEDCEVFDVEEYGVGFSSGSNNSLVARTEVHDTQYEGVYISDSYGCAVEDAEIYDCIRSGILLEYSDDCIIENNSIHNNWYGGIGACGIHLFRSHYCDILGNRLVENARNGIFLEESDYALIQDNTVDKNSDHGILLFGSDHSEIFMNNVTDNGWWPQILDAQCGICIAESTDAYVHGNHVFNNTPSGITVEYAEYITIADNIIDGNTDYGVKNWYSDNVTVVINHVVHNGWQSVDPERCGILMYGHDCGVDGNQVLNNSLNGITNGGDYNHIISNSVMNNEETGISSEECFYNTISDNLVTDSVVGIFVMNIGSNITDNIVCDNEIYGIVSEASGDCRFVGNDIGWNGHNAFETSPLLDNFWYDSISETGNYWSDFNGFTPYSIYNGTGVANLDLYPGYSLNITAADNISYEISAGPEARTMVWPAHAANPGFYILYVDEVYHGEGGWDGSDVAVVIDGVSAGIHEVTLQVFHGNVSHSMNATAYVTVTDATPPNWFGTPGDWVINEGDPFAAMFAVSDHSGFDCFWTNDTVHFIVIWSAEDPTIAYGEVTNATTLSPGEYGIRVYANDTYGNTNFIELKLVVMPTTTTTTTESPILDPVLLLTIGVGAAAVIVIVVVILLRRRG